MNKVLWIVATMLFATSFADRATPDQPLAVTATADALATSSPAPEPAEAREPIATEDEVPEVTEPDPPARSDLAELIEPMESAAYDPADHQPAVPPVWMSIDGIRVDNAPVTPVGVAGNGELEVPPASEVGWYRFGPSPGEPGSAVLAAHIAYNGEDGVFRNLDAVEVGSRVEVGYADGTVGAFEVVGTNRYDKTELPFDQVFTSEGNPILTLITCGGDFNPTLRSYEDNVVAYAVATT